MHVKWEGDIAPSTYHLCPAEASSTDQKLLDFHTDLIFDLLTWPLFWGFCAVAPVNSEFHRDSRSPFIGCQSDIRL